MLKEIQEKLKNFILEYRENIDMPVVIVKREHLLDVIKRLEGFSIWFI